MAITAPHVGTLTESAIADTTAVPYPATVNAGDALVMFGSHNAAAGVVTNPSGWTQVINTSATAGTLTPGLYMAVRYAVGTEGGTTLTVTHPHTVYISQIIAFPGADQSILQDVAAVTVDSGSGATVAMPSMPIRTSGAALVYAATVSGSGSTASPPSGFVETGDKSTTGTRPGTMGYKLNVPTGGTGVQNVVFSGSGNRLGAMIALRPANASRIWFIKKSGVWTGLDEVRF